MTGKFTYEVRSTKPERMDVEATGFEDFAACLRDIARINTATNAHAPTLAWLRTRWAARDGSAPFRILDAGCGYGDTLRAIAREARRRGVCVELVGVDINPWAKRAAQDVTPKVDAVRYETADIFAFDDGPFDAIVSSLFTHHLSDTEVVAFVRWMHASAREGWFVNDLHRHVVPWAFIAATTRALRLHRFVRDDAPLSVARAFRRGDWQRLIERAELTGARTPRVRWEPLFRYCVAYP